MTVVALDPSDGPVPPPPERGQAGGQRLVDLRGREQVDVGVEAAGGEDLALAGDHVGAGADDQSRVDPVGDVGVAAAPDPDDPAGPDADVGADDAPVVEDHHVRDHRVQRALGRGGQATGSSTRGSTCRRRRPTPRRRPSGPARSRSTGRCRPRRTWSPAVGPKIAAYSSRPMRTPQSSCSVDDGVRSCRPGTDRRPRSATIATVRDAPGSKRTDVPAAMSSRNPWRGLAVELETGVDVGEVDVRPDLDRPVGRVRERQLAALVGAAVGVELDLPRRDPVRPRSRGRDARHGSPPALARPTSVCSCTPATGWASAA